MYKILIVDDEVTVLDGLCLLISGKFADDEILRATNGQEALELIKTQDVDILISDISMPLMNGLRLSEQALQVRPQIEIILVSAYEDFEYARQAIDIGVNNYILKPVKMDEMTDVVEEARAHLFKLKKEKNLRESMLLKTQEKTLFDVLQDFQENINHEFAAGHFLREDDNFWAFILAAAYKNKLSEQKIYECLNSGSNFNSANVIVSEYKKDHFAILVSAKEKIRPQNLQGLEICSAPYSACSGAGVFSRETDDLFNAYVMARYMMFHNLLLLASNGENRGEFDPEKDGSNLQIFTRAITAEIPDGINDFIQAIPALYFLDNPLAFVVELEHLYESRKEEDKDLRQTRDYLLRLVIEFADSYYAEIKECEYIRKNPAMFYFLFSASSADDIFRVVCDLISDSARNFRTSKKEHNSLVEKAKKEICSDYNKASLVEIARKLKITPIYLSLLFKQETGENFKDYITRQRIYEAQKLLKSAADLKIYEIAEAVGYNDVKHFSRVFRKITGQLPTEYRGSAD